MEKVIFLKGRGRDGGVVHVPSGGFGFLDTILSWRNVKTNWIAELLIE